MLAVITSGFNCLASRTRGSAVLLAFILVMGAYFRVVDSADVGLGFNETMHVYAAKAVMESKGPVLPSGKVYDRGALFTYTVAGSFKVFGVSLLSARLPSIVFGMFSVLLVFIIGKGFFGTAAGIIAALLMAAMPFQIAWARACRMYAMYQFFFLLSFYVFYRGFEPVASSGGNPGRPSAEKSLQWGWLVLSAVSILVAFHLQPLAVALGAAILVYLFLMLVITFSTYGFGSAIRSRYFWFSLLMAVPLLATIALPQLSAKLESAYRFAPAWAVRKGVSPLYYARFLTGPSLFPVAVLAALGTLQVLSRLNRPGFYTLIAFGLPFAFHSVLANAQSYRYIYDIFPLLLLLAAYAMTNILAAEVRMLQDHLSANPRWINVVKTRRLMLAIPLLGVVFIPFAFAFNDAVHIAKGRMAPLGGEFNAQWEDACRFVNEHWENGDILVASIPLAAEFHGCKPVDYSLDNGEIDQFRKIKGDRFQRHPFADAKTIIDLQDLQSVLSSHPRGWMVLDKGRFHSGNTPSDIREYIVMHLQEQKTEANDTIRVFRWDADWASTPQTAQESGRHHACTD